MATNNTGDWSDLFDVALCEPNRGRLRKRIERAKHAINHRLDILTSDHSEKDGAISERIALSDALTTLDELHKIVYTRKPNAGVKRQDARAAGQADA